MRAHAAALLAATALIAGCGGGGGGSKSPGGSPAQGTQGAQPPSDQAQLQALLDRRARALQHGRVRAYVATAFGAERAIDRTQAANAQGLPLRDVTLKIVAIDVKGSGAVLDVRSGYGIAGIKGDFESRRTVRAVKTAHGWRIRSVASRRQESRSTIGRR